MRVKLAVLIAALSGLSACQLPAVQVPTPDSPRPREAHVGPADIFVVTARGVRCSAYGEEFGPYRELAGLNFGKASITRPPDRRDSPTLLVDPAAWEGDLDQRVQAGAPVIYIHGYNNSEDAAVRRARAIASLLMDSRPVIAVTWPSYANPTAVGWDEANNEWAREALSAELARIVGRYKGATIIAHSMGNRILLDFLVAHPELAANIGQIIAAAPDVDEDLFMRHMQAGASFGPSVTIYASTKDQALAGSWRIHGMRRAGDLSAAAGNERLLIRYDHLDPSVTVIDLSPTSGADWWEHSNFIASTGGAADLCRLLNKMPPIGRTLLAPDSYYQIDDKSSQGDACTERAQHAKDIDAGKD